MAQPCLGAGGRSMLVDVSRLSLRAGRRGLPMS